MPRAPRGALLPPLQLARVRRADLYRLLRDAILDGTLPSATRLPSTRELARERGVARTTAEEAYQQLESEGFLTRARGSGTFVAPALVAAPAATGAPAACRRPSKRGARLAANARCREPERVRPFTAGIPDLAAFPVRAWTRCALRAQRELGRAALNHADARGYWPLRVALARHLAQFRGVRAAPERVVVFTSSQQALLALALLLLDRDDAAWLEDPGYPGARAALELAGARVVPVPVDAHGLVVAAGRRRAPAARLAYVTPAHQYPTGVVLAPERRAELLAWAERADAAVIEDDYDGEFCHVGQPLTALQALDAGGRVIHVGTLSKAMFMGLRLAYAVVPEPLVEPLANLRTQVDGFPPLATQAALAAFIDEGLLAAHVRRMRGVYAERRAQLVAGLAPLVAQGWRTGPHAIGMHVGLIEPRPGLARAVAAASGLELATWSDYAARPLAEDGLFLRYGGLAPEEIDAGVARLRAACRALDGRQSRGGGLSSRRV